MGRTIILAGAPDAASLDWTAIEAEAEPGTTRPWKTSITATDVDASSHPDWRVVPSEVPGEVPAARPNMRPSDKTHDIVRTEPSIESIEQPDATHNRPYLSYGRADFLDLTQATEHSTQKSTQGGTQQAGSLAISSLDETSLSFRLPNALPQISPQLPSLPPPTASFASFTSSQDFLEHSLAVHDALPSSLPAFDLPPIYETNASFDETTMSLSLSESASLSFSSKTLPPLPADIPRWRPLTHLADVPSAAYLLSVAPQTVTVNLVVAIVSVGAPRVVGHDNNPQTRRRDRPPASLVELVVGDETRSGFGLTIWMDGASGATGPTGPTGPSSLATLLPSLAPHDVVLLRHIALHVFGGKVYGRSLRKDQTKMHILHRGGRSGHLQRVLAGDALFSAGHIEAAAAGQLQQNSTQASSSYPAGLQLLAKTARVRNWALRYVIVDGAGGSSGSVKEGDGSGPPRPHSRQAWMMPPADTQ